MCAPDVWLTAPDDHGRLTVGLFDDGPDRDSALLVIDSGELARCTDDHDPSRAVVERPSCRPANSLGIDLETTGQRCQQRGNDAFQTLLKRCHLCCLLGWSPGRAIDSCGTGKDTSCQRHGGEYIDSVVRAEGHQIAGQPAEVAAAL